MDRISPREELAVELERELFILETPGRGGNSEPVIPVNVRRSSLEVGLHAVTAKDTEEPLVTNPEPESTPEPEVSVDEPVEPALIDEKPKHPSQPSISISSGTEHEEDLPQLLEPDGIPERPYVATRSSMENISVGTTRVPLERSAVSSIALGQHFGGKSKRKQPARKNSATHKTVLSPFNSP